MGKIVIGYYLNVTLFDFLYIRLFHISDGVENKRVPGRLLSSGDTLLSELLMKYMKLISV